MNEKEIVEEDLVHGNTEDVPDHVVVIAGDEADPRKFYLYNIFFMFVLI